MPLINGIGVSENTSVKQETFRSIMQTHIKMCKEIFKKQASWRKKEYLYVDLNAGSGRYEGIKGSPLIFLDVVKQEKLNVPINALFCEINQDSWFSLFKECDKYFSDSNLSKYADYIKLTGDIGQAKCINEDNRRWIENLSRTQPKDQKRQYGIIYSDPNNHEANFGGLAKMSKINTFRQTDIMIHISATTMKRMYGANNNNTRLMDAISHIDKKLWIIRRPYTAHQWTFLIGANWDRFPKFKNLGFVELSTKEGQDILTQLNYTAKEVQEQFPDITTKHTLNTCSCLSSKLSDQISCKGQGISAKSAVTTKRRKSTTSNTQNGDIWMF